MLAIAKVRTENGLKDDSDDSERDEDSDDAPSNNRDTLRKSSELGGGSLDLSGSIAARNRRREKLPVGLLMGLYF